MAPNVCYVHPSALGSNGNVIASEAKQNVIASEAKQNVIASEAKQKVRMDGGISVMSKPTVPRHHFWLGREEAAQRRRAVKK